MTELIYNEKQTFRNTIMICIPIGFLFFFICGFYRQFYLHIPFGNHPMSNTGFIFVLIGFILFLVFFLSISLETKIYTEGISIRFYPIQLKHMFLSWDEIEKVEIIKYNPILEYGGWGYRGFKNSSKRALNISGNKGIKIYFFDGKSLLVGTQKPEEFKLILSKIENINTKFSS
jgi:hypothetical protein